MDQLKMFRRRRNRMARYFFSQILVLLFYWIGDVWYQFIVWMKVICLILLIFKSMTQLLETLIYCMDAWIFLWCISVNDSTVNPSTFSEVH
jgi:hypothetical protein